MSEARRKKKRVTRWNRFGGEYTVTLDEYREAERLAAENGETVQSTLSEPFGTRSDAYRAKAGHADVTQ